tara:strand:+ start:55 stop:183 length:129 start_codon:yes stop_codon:yes gene_type:complete
MMSMSKKQTKFRGLKIDAKDESIEITKNPKKKTSSIVGSLLW